MKSIMEESSSIIKAVQQAWQRAGQPQEFSVKILEHPQTSFFGLKTAKSAKIALFFTEMPMPAKPREHHAQKPRMQARPSSKMHDSSELQQPKMQQRRYHEDQPREPREPRRTPQRPPQQPMMAKDPQQQRMPTEYDQWNLDMVNFVREWIKETLVLMGTPQMEVEAHVSGNYLKILLAQPLSADPKADEIQLKSWAGLAMEAVRENFHRPLRNLRIILESKK